ncbi:MAG: hypothetical protein AAGD38_13225 [Acidobacteriota bacterium]
MQRSLLSLMLIVGCGLLALPADADERREPRAVTIAENALEALGGQAGLDATRHIRFNFFGFRTHHWDRQTGDHRLEGQTRDGDTYVVLHNIDSRDGKAWLNGEAVTGDALKTQLDQAYGAWINDVYWLMFPFKLLDPGVNLSYSGEEEIDGVTYDIVELSFEKVGLTPGDRYWAWVDRASGMMARWAFHLESWEADRERSVWTWTDWETYGALKLASTRTNLESGRVASIGDIAVFDSLPASVYTTPDPVSE